MILAGAYIKGAAAGRVYVKGQLAWSAAVEEFAAKVVADGGTVDSVWSSEYESANTLIKNQSTDLLVPGAFKSGTLYGLNLQDGTLIPFAFSRTSTATYFDKNGIMQTAAANVPRIDYNPTTKALKGYLLENAVTNLCLNSSNFGASTWAKTGTAIVASNFSAPTLELLASRIRMSGTLGRHSVGTTATIPAATNFTCSVFLKKGEIDKAILLLNDSGYAKPLASVTVNLTTGLIISAVDPLSPTTITALPDGWFRVSISVNSNTSTTAKFDIILGDTLDNVQGVSTSALFMWGGQIEVGSSPTSYIPTVAVTAARTAGVTTFNVPSTGSLFINNNGVKTVQTVNSGTFTLPVGAIKSLALFPRILTAAEITQITA